ncbi:hypothetical protein IKE67_08805 [bacterium]|nr:hypothetical protein [bacterium]
MAVDNNTIIIGGVTFNKNNVKSSEVVVKDGQEINSVFLQDGTHIEFPTQSAENRASVSQSDTSSVEPDLRYGVNPLNGEVEPHIWFEDVPDASRKQTLFEGFDGAVITGTDRQDSYTLRGCRNTEVDLSQDDGQADTVTDEPSGGIFSRRNNTNNTYHLGDSDTASVVDGSVFGKNHKGPNTYNSGK